MRYTITVINEKDINNTIKLREGFSSLITIKKVPVDLKFLTKYNTVMHHKAEREGSYIFNDSGILQEYTDTNTLTAIDVTNSVEGLDTGSFVPRSNGIIESE